MRFREQLITWGIAAVLIVGVIGLYRLKTKRNWDGWRQGVMYLFGRALGAVGWFFSKKVPWKPLLIWGPWVIIILVLCGYGFENWRGTRAWERVERELAIRGESLVVEDYLPRGVGDEDNIAKHPVTVRLLANPEEVTALGRAGIAGFAEFWEHSNLELVEPADVRNWLDPPLTAGTEEEAARKILDLAAAQFAVLDELAEALERPACQPEFPRDEWELPGMPNGFYAIYFGSMANLRHRAALCAKTGQAELCGESLVANIRLAERVMPIYTLFSGNLKMNMTTYSSGGLWDVLPLHVLDDQQLAAIDEALAEIDFREDFAALLRGERAYMVRVGDYCRDHRSEYLDEIGRVGFDFSGVSSVGEFWDSLAAGCRELRFNISPPGSFELSKARSTGRLNRFIEDFEGASTRLLVEEVLPQWEAIESEPAENLFSVLSGGGYTASEALENMLTGEVELAVAVAAIALERYYLQHGRYPARAEDLVPSFLKSWPMDSTSLLPLGYELKSDGSPCLFSLGFDREPDTGDDFVWEYTKTVARALSPKRSTP